MLEVKQLLRDYKILLAPHCCHSVLETLQEFLDPVLLVAPLCEIEELLVLLHRLELALEHSKKLLIERLEEEFKVDWLETT